MFARTVPNVGVIRSDWSLSVELPTHHPHLIPRDGAQGPFGVWSLQRGHLWPRSSPKLPLPPWSRGALVTERVAAEPGNGPLPA